jgi:hypothetical protein
MEGPPGIGDGQEFRVLGLDLGFGLGAGRPQETLHIFEFEGLEMIGFADGGEETGLGVLDQEGEKIGGDGKGVLAVFLGFPKEMG